MIGALVLLVGASGVSGMLSLEHPHFVAKAEARLLGLLPQQQPAPVNLDGVAIRCDVNSSGTAISPLIYGVSSADPATLKALGATLNRWGGNPSDSYNWVLGAAWNAGRDWGFRNVDYASLPGSSADNFVSSTLGAGDVPLMTVPALGWVAKDSNNNHQSNAVPAQGGAPLKPGSDAIAGYNPSANQAMTSVMSLPSRQDATTSTPSSAIYQDGWVRHLAQTFGTGSKGVSYYTIGNEPDLWSYTHTDVHPVEMGYDSMFATYESYARAVKAQDPGAQILGPDVSGWTAMWYSALDRGSDNYATHADRQAHGGQPFLPWWLAQVAASDRASGQRTLDYLDVHYYPQASGVDSDASDPATQLLRIRSTQSLNNPNYTDESWIAQPVDLIPRLKGWIAANYPGTKLAITEYRWGATEDASGAVALALVLGIFGRDGVDLASYWEYPPVDSPAGAAFRLYRNYDGHGATFGDRSLPCQSSASQIAVFGSRHSNDGEVDLIVANENPTQTTTISLNLGSGSARSVDRFQVAAGSHVISQLESVSSTTPFALPPFSLSLLRVKAA